MTLRLSSPARTLIAPIACALWLAACQGRDTLEQEPSLAHDSGGAGVPASAGASGAGGGGAGGSDHGSCGVAGAGGDIDEAGGTGGHTDVSGGTGGHVDETGGA